MKKFAIDLTALDKIEAGLGYYVSNMLNGLNAIDDEYELYLITSHDNSLFDKYTENRRIKIIRTDCPSNSKIKRVLWINAKLSKKLNDLRIKDCIEPYYCMPIINTRGIRYYTTIHDLQALHYPEFLSKKQNLWLRFMWAFATRKAYKLLTISDYSKEDIESHYKISKGKIKTIYNAVSVKEPTKETFDIVKKKYGVDKGSYYYTVSKLRKNKNFGVLIDAYKEMLQAGLKPDKLLVSGSNGGDGEALQAKIKENSLEKYIILTGFIDDEERNTLYKNAKAFLFPSIFEGFGMTVIEAMALGTPVITTKCTSIYEVSQGKANYVDDPLDSSQWIELMNHFDNRSNEIDMSQYSIEYFAKMILDYIDEVDTNCL